MKIAIDLRPLQIGHQNRGIGAYLINLLQRLPDNPNIEYIFVRYSNSQPLADFHINVPDKHREVVLTRHKFSKHPIAILKYGYYNLLPNYRALRRHRPDVFVQPDYLLGAPRLYKCRVVTICYDLIPPKFKQIYLPRWTKYLGFSQFKLRSRIRLAGRAWFYQKKYDHGCRLLRRSDAIVSISQHTKKDIMELLGIDSGQIHVVYPAASFRNDTTEQLVDKDIKELSKLKEPYITYIGGTDQRRQIHELIFAFNLYNARHNELHLVLCGNEFEKNSTEINPLTKQAIEASSYRPNIHTFGRITEAEKKFVLEHTAAFVYPTLYEGFGLPVIEAMACGTPVISYRNSSLPEIAGDFPLYTDSDNGYAIYCCLRTMLNRKPLSSSERQAAINHAQRFNWENCARGTWAVITNQAI